MSFAANKKCTEQSSEMAVPWKAPDLRMKETEAEHRMPELQGREMGSHGSCRGESAGGMIMSDVRGHIQTAKGLQAD